VPGFRGGTALALRDDVRSFRSLTLVAASWLFLQTSAFAQTPPSTHGDPPSALDGEPAARAVTLDEALAYARTHQPAVVAARARIAAAVAEGDVPRSLWKPTVGVTAQLFGATANNTTGSYASISAIDIPRIGATRSVSSVGGAAFQPYATSFVGIGVGQELFDFGRIAARAAALDALVDVAKEESSLAVLDLEIQVRESFYAVLAAKGVLAASEGAFRRSQVHRDFAKAGVDQGLRPPIELTRAEADLARFDVGRIRARGGLRAAQSVLAAAVGIDDLVLDTAGDAPPVDDVPSLREALRRAAERDPAIREAVARLKAQEARTKAISAETRPDVSLTATLSGRAGGAPPTSGEVPTGNGLLPYVPNWDVGVVFTWPIYDPTVNARAEASSAHEAVERAGIDVVKKEQVAAVQRAYVSLDVARMALPALDRAFSTAVANSQQADARFKQGLGTSVELADAESLRARAEIDVALGKFDVARARAQLARVLAEGL
jgi:outer membrane protein TolC